MAKPLLITPELLASLSERARQNPRLRQNLNFHAGPDAPAQCLLNAIEPGSYVQPHRHLQPRRDETLLMLQGRLGLILFTEEGEICSTHILAASSSTMGFHLPAETWHSVVALESGTVFFEAKDGPYLPLSDADRASWAPPENTPEASALQEALRKRFPA